MRYVVSTTALRLVHSTYAVSTSKVVTAHCVTPPHHAGYSPLITSNWHLLQAARRPLYANNDEAPASLPCRRQFSHVQLALVL